MHRASAHSILRSTFVYTKWTRPGILTRPHPRGRALEDQAACFERGAHLRHPAAQCLVGMHDAAFTLQPGTARVTVSTAQDKHTGPLMRTAALSLICTLSGNPPCESRNDQSPSLCPPMALDGLSRLSGSDVNRSCGIPDCVIYWRSPTNRQLLYIAGMVGGSSGAQGHFSHLSPLPVTIHYCFIQRGFIDSVRLCQDDCPLNLKTT